MKRIVVSGVVAVLSSATLGACTVDGTAPSVPAPRSDVADHAIGSTSSVDVSDVLGMHADWAIPRNIDELVRVSRPDAELLGVPVEADLGNAYVFDDGKGGTLDTAYISVVVSDSSTTAYGEGERLTIELPMPAGTTAEALAAIDFGQKPWAFTITRAGVFADGDVTDARDLDGVRNPSNVVGGAGPTTIFEVVDGEVVLPIIGEPGMTDADASSTAGLRDQIAAAIQRARGTR